MRPAVDVVDSTWIGARPAVVAAALVQPGNWRRWWPALQLRVDELRAEKGVRWHVDSVADVPAARLRGSAEVWLEHTCGGVVAHFFLRLDPAPGATLANRQREQLVSAYRTHTKAAFWALGDQLEPARLHRHVSPTHAAVT